MDLINLKRPDGAVRPYFSPTAPSILILFCAVFLCCCTPDKPETELENQKETAGPLPSWHEGASRTAIINFVTGASEAGSDQFIPVADRIAVFDNDGTLWAEKPVYFQLLFVKDRIRELAAEHPEWRDEYPYKAVLENDMDTLSSFGTHGLAELLMASHAGMTATEFEAMVKDWISTARHPELGQPYTELVYQPMQELLDYLREHDFKVFIVSGGGIEFMRPWAEEVYGIPKNQIIGSSIKTEYALEDGNPVIQRLPEVDFIDDKEGKPVGIWRFIGRKPVLAAGNSDGDLQMLQFTTSQPNALAVYIHHTDSVREWAYDRESAVGRLDAGLDEAEAQHWLIVDMKDDWKRVFPFEN